ncbi:fimbrial biogenesis chaperone [Dyella nitratireducens]|uniref:Fimbria-related chaperone n=1 Tax=Dyella nitratireducens TaxID=1849580 RepID=A0ABQ1FZL6_9GAMM|nr:fimbria/pilus periplasmic chaperone [Dyella nitratireducens]GGA34574.1 fimbria-related chaperone [Dyella nitratireducens]GLQ40885.1 fimbria-related chaperone [Dyella nitratireducens]
MTTRFIFNACLATICCLIGFLAAPVRAGVVIEKTRLIYPAQEREVTVSLVNDNKDIPVLVQAWIDEGDQKSAPDQIQVPFLLVPPVFRMEPGKSQSLRISSLPDKSLPTDKESVFWLNVMEVPPKPKAAKDKASNTLQLAFRTRIKLFFRPNGLVGAVGDAPGQLRWKLEKEGTRQVLEANNPSSYYVSFEKVSLLVDGKEVKSEDPQMIEPGGTQRFVLDAADLPVGVRTEVQFTHIDDYGQIVAHTATLMR